jgi:SLOG cluster2
VSGSRRPLSGRVVNLSISETNDSAGRGFPQWQVNRVTLQTVAALFGQGVTVVFGHDWREDGVMEAVYGFARQAQPPVPLSDADARAVGQPILRNLLPWPDTPRLPPQDLERMASTLRVEPAGLPEHLVRYEDEARRAGPGSPVYGYLRSRALTHLRHRLTALCDARICFGGRESSSEGRYPGVVEEALLAVRHNKPLYLAGFLGGAAAQLVQAIERRNLYDAFCPQDAVQKLYRNPPVPEDEGPDVVVNREALWSEFGELLDKKPGNGLTFQENQELMHTPVIDRALELILTGLSRI